MTTAHSIKTSEEPLLKHGAPWLPVSFLLQLFLSPWIRNHPDSFSSEQGPALSFSLLWQTANTQTHTHPGIITQRHIHTFTDLCGFVCEHRLVGVGVNQISGHWLVTPSSPLMKFMLWWDPADFCSVCLWIPGLQSNRQVPFSKPVGLVPTELQPSRKIMIYVGDSILLTAFQDLKRIKTV